MISRFQIINIIDANEQTDIVWLLIALVKWITLICWSKVSYYFTKQEDEQEQEQEVVAQHNTDPESAPLLNDYVNIENSLPTTDVVIIYPFSIDELNDFKKKFSMDDKYMINSPVTIIYSNGDRYQGEVVINTASNNPMQYTKLQISGYGEMVYKDGDVYKGEWSQNKWHGKNAFIKYADGESYEGEVEYGEKKGYGVFKWSNGVKYEGYWLNDNLHGEGVVDASETTGEIYFGPWDQGCQQ